MITEVVTLKFPTGITREQLISNYRQTAPKWRGNRDLIRKNCVYNGTNAVGGGVYLRKGISAPKKWHNDRWRQGVIERYGSEPNITYFETAIVVDNLAHVPSRSRCAYDTSSRSFCGRPSSTGARSSGNRARPLRGLYAGGCHGFRAGASGTDRIAYARLSASSRSESPRAR